MKKFGLTLLLVGLVLFFVISSSAANHYVRAGATGNGSGSDWTNACTDFTGSCAVSSLVRGDTYYVAGGNYASWNFSTPASGTSVITIKKATVADHGTSSGWSNTYGTTQAILASGTWQTGCNANICGIVFSTPYWILDGNGTFTTIDSNIADYGFVIAQPGGATSCTSNGQSYIWIADVSNVTLRYVALNACGPSYDTQQRCFDTGQGSNRWFSHLYASNCQQAVYLWSGSSSIVGNDIIEYVYMTNAWSSSAHHGEQFGLVCQNATTIRYNFWHDCAGTGCIAAIDPCAAGLNNGAIYGNVFQNNSGGNGAVASGTQASICINNTVVYNNTFNNVGTAFLDGPSNCGGNVIENNLILNGGSIIVNGSATVGYNSWWNSGGYTAGTNAQTLTSNPTVSSSTGNYQLATDTAAWLSMGSPYNIDPSGVTRSSSRGAYQYLSSSQVPPPTGLTATVQ